MAVLVEEPKHITPPQTVIQLITIADLHKADLVEVAQKQGLPIHLIVLLILLLHQAVVVAVQEVQQVAAAVAAHLQVAAADRQEVVADSLLT